MPHAVVPHAVVIGGGIVGAACAHALHRAGWKVTLLSGEPLGGGSTAAGMGHLVVMDDSPAQLALTARSVELWRELSRELPASAEYRETGTLWVASDQEELGAVRPKQAAYRGAGVEAELLDGAELARLEPELRQGLAGGLRVPGDAVVYAQVAAAYLARHAAVLRGRAAALTKGGVQLEGGGHLSADLTVLAAGAGSAKLLPELPLRPRKGHLLITERGGPAVHHQLVELGYLKSAHEGEADSVAFNAQPRPTGQLLIGSSRQFDRPGDGIDWHILRSMLRRAVAYLPALRGALALRAWTGQRLATSDHLPLIGPHSERPNLFLACGHEGLGVTTALGTAELLRAFVTGEHTPLAPRDYAPDRLNIGAIHA